jgi:hypothetical protein
MNRTAMQRQGSLGFSPLENGAGGGIPVDAVRVPIGGKKISPSPEGGEEKTCFRHRRKAFPTAAQALSG